jgi:hypothetical protein
MLEHTLTADYPDDLRADSVIGRLEVLGIPMRNITKTSAAGTRVEVSAKVEDRLVEKARQILVGG